MRHASADVCASRDPHSAVAQRNDQSAITTTHVLSMRSRAFSALCMYSKIRHHLHPLGYLCAKFHFFLRPHCWASPFRKIVYSINHPAYLMPQKLKLSLWNKWRECEGDQGWKPRQICAFSYPPTLEILGRGRSNHSVNVSSSAQVTTSDKLWA